MEIIINYEENKEPLKLLLPTAIFIKIIPYFYLDKHIKKCGIDISEEQLKTLRLYFKKIFKNYKKHYKEQYRGWKLIEISSSTGEKVEIIL